MKPLRTTMTLLLAAALLSATPPPAAAAPETLSTEDKALAAELKKQGDEAMLMLHYADALDAYTRAYSLTHDPALLYNRGRALQALGKLPQALEQIEAFDAAASTQLKARVPALDALIAELRSKVAAITLSSNVEGARILINKQVIGVTPLRGQHKLNAGPVVVEVEAEGYLPFRQKVELEGGKTVAIDARLSVKSMQGLLSVVSPTRGAHVFVDDKAVGSVPVEISIKAGLHSVRVEGEEHEPVSTSVVVAAGARKQINVPLAPEPVTKRWWFWTSVGAGAAALAAAAVIIPLTTPRAPDRGTIPPGIILWPPPSGGSPSGR